jgi:hypothetical protein
MRDYHDDLRRSFDDLRKFALNQTHEDLHGMLFQLWNEIVSMESLQSSNPDLPVLTNEAWRIAKVTKYAMLILAYKNTTITDPATIARGGAGIELPSGEILTVNSSEEDFERFARTLPRFSNSDSTSIFTEASGSQSKGCFSLLLCAFTFCILIIICCATL